jgi:hypothetical protein
VNERLCRIGAAQTKGADMKKVGFSALALAVVVGLTATVAAAPAVQTCTITRLAVTANRLTVYCSETGTTTTHQIAGPGYSASCPAHSADDMRNYESFLLSAYLAGKKVSLQYDTPTICTGPANLAGSRVVFAMSTL